ncbi:uncharacterized protein (UPF0335 family) [Lysinibacillus composti]|uniref:hypothetical protein n=1 Tax=Lysinibacillus composti TaxID=720633 RepID=UPI0013158233|nr:hypothetical protein [Lysinibacillus composti]MBM7609616.1 uncharacterized protein (UPF0335 family) [Lysinibacillus composti]
MMETNEKAARLQVMLQEALQPMIDKIDSLEQEVKMLQEGQKKLQKLLSEKE